jgi:hypothetical protein
MPDNSDTDMILKIYYNIFIYHRIYDFYTLHSNVLQSIVVDK